MVFGVAIGKILKLCRRLALSGLKLALQFQVLRAVVAVRSFRPGSLKPTLQIDNVLFGCLERCIQLPPNIREVQRSKCSEASEFHNSAPALLSAYVCALLHWVATSTVLAYQPNGASACCKTVSQNMPGLRGPPTLSFSILSSAINISSTSGTAWLMIPFCLVAIFSSSLIVKNEFWTEK